MPEISDIFPQHSGNRLKFFKLPAMVLTISTIISLSNFWPVAAEGYYERKTIDAFDKLIYQFSFTEKMDNPFMVKGIQTLAQQNPQEQLLQKQNEVNDFYSNLSQEYKEIIEDREKVEKLVNFLRSQRSPVATYSYAQQIISVSEANGADYKVIVAIMGVESGFCKANYKKYNCFGFLNKVQYSGYQEAFNKLIPQIAKMYVKPFGSNFAGLLKAYGVHNVDYHLPRMQKFYNSLG